MHRLLFVGLLLAGAVQTFAADSNETTLEYGPFGKVTLYAKSAHPGQVVLFVSGDGGWNLGVIDMARALAELDALVVRVDITHYLKVLEQMLQFRDAFLRIAGAVPAATAPAQVDNLPLVELPAGGDGDTLAILLTGDGGWAGIDRDLAAEIRAQVELVALLAPGRRGELAFHIGDWVGVGGAGGTPLEPEVARLGGTPVLCIYGADDADDSLCPQLHGARRQVLQLPGGHHFGGDYRDLVDHVLAAADSGRPGKR